MSTASNPVSELFKPASDGCCSYSAECRGAEAGLDLLTRNDSTPPAAVIWITDSRSLVQALAKGCLLQTGYAEAHIWRSLLDLASRGIKVAVTWVFSHCGQGGANDRADEAAGEAAQDALTQDESPAPWWYVDAARARYRKTFQDYDKRLEAFQENRTEPDSCLRTLCPLKVSTMDNIAPRLQKTLSCLRSGAWHPLGIVHGEHPTCAVCGTAGALGRQRGVAHLFTCQAPEAVNIRPTGISLDTLWSSNTRMLKATAMYALDFKRLLRGAPQME